MVSGYLSEINPSFDHPLIQKMKTYAKKHHVPIMQDEGIHFLIQLLKISRAKNVLEIGTAIGYSAILMVLFSDVKVISIERDDQMYQLATENVKTAGLEKEIDLVFGDAKDDLIKNEMFDLLFIDAAKASYITFFEKYAPMVKQGGIIISDNLLFRGYVAHPETIESRNRKQLVKKINHYNEFLLNQSNFDSYIYAIGDGISVSIKK